MAVTTAYTSPLSGTLDKSTGGTVDETMTDAIASNDLHSHGTVGYIGCEAQQSGATSVTNNSLGFQVNLATENTDTDPNGAMHDTVTNNTRITVRTAGVYHATAYISFAANASGIRKANIRLNGATDLAGMSSAAVSGLATEFSLARSRLFAANDYIELTCFQNSGGALNLDAAVLSLIKA